MPPFRQVVLCGCLLAVLSSMAGADEGYRVTEDIEFARVGETHLALDLYRPDETEGGPLIVWVHGGAWRRGTRANMPLTRIVQAGYAVASVDYRLSPVAPFPAQVHDIKAAIRYLRAHQEELRVDGDRIAIAGASAGGHLAALVGVTNGHAELEGDVGADRNQSSDVQAIVDFYGPTDLVTILNQSTPHGLGVRIPALELLLLGQPADKPDLARLASPVFYVEASDPPLLLLHGDQDPQVPINQAHELEGRYEALGLPVEFEVVHGAPHGGEVFHDEARTAIVLSFLDRCFKEAAP